MILIDLGGVYILNTNNPQGAPADRIIKSEMDLVIDYICTSLIVNAKRRYKQ